MPSQTPPGLPCINASNLHQLDNGIAGAIIDAAIRDAVNDIDDRGHQDKKPRQVIITLTMDKLDNGQVVTIVEAHIKTPRRRSASTVCNMLIDGRQAKLEFHASTPDNPNQRSIEDIIEGQGVDE